MAENKDKEELKEKVSELLIYNLILCEYLKHRLIKGLILFSKINITGKKAIIYAYTKLK